MVLLVWSLNPDKGPSGRRKHDEDGPFTPRRDQNKGTICISEYGSGLVVEGLAGRGHVLGALHVGR